MTRPIEIVGGGLAGLALGLGLRRAGVDATIFEAGSYPRHRVCGEFITGLGDDTIAALGLAPLLDDATHLREVQWLVGDAPPVRYRLPVPALAISRFALDARLARAFEKAGGRLVTGARISDDTAREGRVFSTGRRRAASSRWLGLKAHACGMPLASDLEFHLANDAYVGLSPIGGGRVNVCGLFRQRPELAATRETVLLAYLRAVGLERLAARVAAAELCPEAHSAVAGVAFDRSGCGEGRMNLGDAFAMIPPFTGNGMAMAFQSAQTALEPLVAWSRGESSWDRTLDLVGDRLRRRFRRRLATAHWLHPFLHDSRRQPWLATAARLGALPLTPLYHLLH